MLGQGECFMILYVSGRTDIVAFYIEWFMNRYKEGFVDVRNPFNRKLISRIFFSDVDLILFCTKNPKPIVRYLKEIDKPIIFHVTLTPYKLDIEPNVLDKADVIDSIKEVSKILGKANVVVRYDPILINSQYDLSYHVKAFDKLCSLLNGYVSKVIVSFVDNYKNVRDNMNVLSIKDLSLDDYKTIGVEFSKSASKHGMSVQTCFEEHNLCEYGFVNGECLSLEDAYVMTGKKFKKWNARGCGCACMVDIGEYNSCKHFCKYCYANFDEKRVASNVSMHDSNSSLLIGHVNNDDVIKVRKN